MRLQSCRQFETSDRRRSKLNIFELGFEAYSASHSDHALMMLDDEWVRASLKRALAGKEMQTPIDRTIIKAKFSSSLMKTAQN
jgi:hypothetical protein